MKHNYKRPEQFGFTFEDYDKEYQKRYPGYHGPSSSSDCCGENNVKECGCWVCRYIIWCSESGKSFSSSSDIGKLYLWDRICGFWLWLGEKLYALRERRKK